MRIANVITALITVCATLPTFSATALQRIDERVAPCASCHGEQGRSLEESYYPSIAGKPERYLFNQLRHFRDGRRQHAVMGKMLAPLSDDYLRRIARYYAAQTPRLAAPIAVRDARLDSQAQQLVTQGDPSHDIPACTDCHGKNLHGRLPAIPGLTGLGSDYIAAQMGAWRSGVRSSGEPDCMGDIARRLNSQQITAVANWLAAQPSSDQDRPAPASDAKLPLRCFVPEVNTIETEAPDEHAADGQYARGKYLVRAGNCGGCHANKGGESLSGGVAITTPFGAVYSSNLTPDKTTGIGDWSRDDFWNALHNGVSPDGRLLYPAFPYTHYSLVTRQDSDAMLAYLKAQNPVTRVATPHDLRFPFNTQLALWLWRKWFFTAQTFVPDTQHDAAWNRGRYLVEGLGHCNACHGERNALGASRKSRAFAGSLLPDRAWYAPPLRATQSADDRADLLSLLKHGTSGNRVATGPMGEVVASSTQFLTEDDLAAMISYIDSRSPEYPTEVDSLIVSDNLRERQMLRGKDIYQKHCRDCHGEQGEGEPRVYPPLQGNELVLGITPRNAIQTVKFGGYAPSTKEHPYPFGMPPFAHQLGDGEIAAVLTYIRNAWGNQASAVSPVEVAR